MPASDKGGASPTGDPPSGASQSPAPGAAETAPFTLGELAELLDARVVGDETLRLTGLRTLERAEATDLSFLHAPALIQRAAASRAGAFLLSEALAEAAESLGRPLLVVPGDSNLALARVIEHLRPTFLPAPGIHPTAVVEDGCELGEDIHVGPYAVIGAGSRLGDRTVVEAHCVIGRGCSLGSGVRLYPGVVLYDGCGLGDRVIVHSGAVLGSDGFGYATVGGVHHKVPQVGRVVVGEDAEVGANSTIDRAVLESTEIGAGTKIDNLVQVGHNVVTGRGCILCGQAGIAGSTALGDYVVLAGQAGIVNHLEIGDGVQVAAKAAVMQDQPPGLQVAGIPAVDLKAWRRRATAAARLPELARRIRRLEKQLEALSETTRSEGD
ncbi:MAG: UDP-3-O-(3-hydroxymyristoyl)glucosamine N-acyltransferase [Acidobacteriota bacterium]